MRPTATSKSSNATKDSDVQTPEKPLSRFEVAAATTRARMADIMGPRRRQGQASGSKTQNYTSLSRYRNSDEK
ncbi:hypothetical protein BDU57DRAFT_451304 [Ampelomyces quisqualis]|uniref:Uncharacterized protein n=1 Tax=Ampelomyces quisqualis TaxID=50730 RepID=A0A6A5QIH1_AMPQU|nr:hypothetical protein BDU57DRAFT_451304 [Ampelomyces quisqualis]